MRGTQFAGDRDGEAPVWGGLPYPKVRAEIPLASGVVRLPEESSSRNLQPLAAAPDVEIVGPEAPAERPVKGASLPQAKGLALEIHLLAPENVWVKGKDVDVELSGDVTVKSGDGK